MIRLKSWQRKEFIVINNLNKKNIKIFKKVSFDIFVSILSSLVPILFLQFVLLPIIGRKYIGSDYGLILTLISLITLSTQSFSTALTNSKLLKNSEYIEKKICGDFNLILIFYCFMNTLIIGVGTFIYSQNLNFLQLGLIVLIANIQLVRKYLLVYFRLKIEYSGVLNSNIFLLLGYLVGIPIFMYTHLWEVVYLLGELFGLIFILKKSTILKESFKKTALFKNTFSCSSIILIGSFLATINSHIDRLILFPILGGEVVAIYYISSLFGKTLALIVAPINSVILSYISKISKIDNKSFNLLLYISAALGVISYLLIVTLSKPILKLLYPVYVDDAMNFIHITTLASIFLMLAMILNPLVMKFKDIKWQIWINLFNNIVYIGLAITLVKNYNLYGFCIATLISSLFKFILVFIIYQKKS